jgi:hypothetical protein
VKNKVEPSKEPHSYLDGLEAMKLKGEPTIPLHEFINEQNKKRGLNV